MQLQHQVQSLKSEARQMVAAPTIDARYGARFINNLLNCAAKAERANLKMEADELRTLASRLQSRLRVGAE